MNSIKFTVPGAAAAQGRPRFTTRGGYPRAYDPQKSRDYKKHVSTSVLIQARAAGVRDALPVRGPVYLSVTEQRAVPKSWSRVKRAAAIAGDILPTTRPDIDNVVKGIKDALNGLLWADDSQVVQLSARKVYAETPGVIIEFTFSK